MSLYSRYNIVEPIAEPRIQSFEAREIASGRRVIVHFLFGSGEHILRRIAQIPARSRTAILEVGEQDGNPFVVTEELGGPLLAWLDVQARSTSSPEAAVPIEPRAPIAAEDERAHSSVPAPPAGGPGEFTRMFLGGQTEPERGGAPAVEDVRAEDKQPRGEFTRMFGVQAEPSISEPVGEAPGDITGAFARKPRSASPPPIRPEPPPKPRPEPAVDGPNAPNPRPADETPDFLPRRRPVPVEDDLPSRNAKPNPLDIIDRWNETAYGPANPPPRSMQSPGPPPPVNQPQGPSEYTRAILASPSPGPGPASNSAETALAAAKPSAEPRWKPYVPLMVVLGCLAVIAVALVLFFAGRG